MIAYMRAGGLIYHFGHEPFFLELTMDNSLFTTVDESKDKLSLETFVVIFIVWIVGILLAIISHLVEVCYYKRSMKTIIGN